MKPRTMSEGLKYLIEKAQYDAGAGYDAAVMLEAEGRGQSAVQHFFLRSASNGCVSAMLRIAGFYLQGKYLVEDDDGQNRRYIQNIAEGLHWIRLAAATGDALSNYMLARCYADGIGVEKNLSEASYHLTLVPFSDWANPYEPAEALVFGNVSQTLKDCVRRRQKLAFPNLGVGNVG